MATDTPNGEQPNGNQELPTPEFSEQPGASSTSSGNAEEIVSKLTPVIEDIVKRTVQSNKDKRISAIEKSMGRLGLLAELEEQGVSIPKDVRTEMQIRELQERINQPPAQPVQTSVDGSTQQRTAVTEAIAELQKLELDQNDPAFLEVLRGKYQNRAAFDLAVQKYIVNKLKPPKPANVADLTQGQTNTRTTEKGSEALVSDYKKEMLAAPRGPKGDAQRRAIKDKYIEQGVPVGSVDFTS